MRFFTEPHYARQAFANCLIRIGESPVWIGDFNGWSTSFYYPLNSKKTFIEDIREVKHLLNIEPVPLGYVNHKNGASYVRRAGARQWKQGLNRDNLRGPVINKGVLLKSKELARTIKGKFPSYDEAYNIYSRTGKSRAFSREWALTSGLLEPDLCYKDMRVGIGTIKGPKLLPEFEYLTESLMETINDNSK